MEKKRTVKTALILFGIVLFAVRDSHAGDSGLLGPANGYYLFFMILAVAGYFLKKRWIRWLVMLGSLAVLGFLQMGCPSPLGALQNSLIGPMSPVKIQFLIKLAIVLLPAFFLGSLFCGWVCPKGVIQELIHRKDLMTRIPESLDRWLRRIPYMILILVIAVPVLFHRKIFSESTSPFKVLFNLMGSSYAIGFFILILIASIFIYRPFCKYICPVGALLNLASKIGIFRLRLPSNCNTCGLCTKNCAMQALTVNRKIENCIELDKSKCIACGECLHACRKNS